MHKAKVTLLVLVFMRDASVWTLTFIYDQLFLNSLSYNTLLGGGLGTDRSGVLAAGPETAGNRSHFRLAGFCRTGNRCF